MVEKNSFRGLQQAGISGSLAVHILAALGGASNIQLLDACITRLRVTVNDPAQVNLTALKQLGALGVLNNGNNLQAIFGIRSEKLKEEIKRIISPDSGGQTGVSWPVFAPLSGEVIPITEVPDPVFAEKMMGDGLAFKPQDGLVLSPVKGKVVNIFPTKHALGLVSITGLQVLVHVGIDTVKLRGQGFELLAEQEQEVEVGDPLLRFDLECLARQAKSAVTPIVFTNLKAKQSIAVNYGQAEAAKTLVCNIYTE